MVTWHWKCGIIEFDIYIECIVRREWYIMDTRIEKAVPGDAAKLLEYLKQVGGSAHLIGVGSLS